MMLEKDVERWAVIKAKKAGYWTRKFAAPGNRSVPDRLFGRDGQVMFVEFKRPGGKPTELQLMEHAEMRSFGLEVHVIDSREAFAALLEAKGDWLG